MKGPINYLGPTSNSICLLNPGRPLTHAYLFITNRNIRHPMNGPKMTTSNFYQRFDKTLAQAFWLPLSGASCILIQCIASIFCPTHVGPFNRPVLWAAFSTVLEAVTDNLSGMLTRLSHLPRKISHPSGCLRAHTLDRDFPWPTYPCSFFKIIISIWPFFVNF